MLTLDTFGGFLSIAGFPTDFIPEEMIEGWVEKFPEELVAEPTIVEMGENDGVAYALVEDEAADASHTIYVEARELAAATDDEPAVVTLTFLVSTPGTFANNAVSAAAAIEIDGDPLFAGLDFGEADARDDDRDGDRREEEQRDPDAGDRRQARGDDAKNRLHLDDTDEDEE
jgi:hypothetical protein